MASLARRTRRTTDIWPGFVDALATLLIIIIFILMVFVLGQFFLGQALSGRDAALERLTAQVNEIGEMLALERQARQARRGIWRLGYYAIRSLDEASRHTGSFQLVEGRVREVATVRKRSYLNFGENWRTDFTIVISPSDRRQFLKAGFDPANFRGRRVRVRGWLKSYNGPMIEVTHPEQIEVLDE